MRCLVVKLVLNAPLGIESAVVHICENKSAVDISEDD